ncbi:MAG TPA: thiamine phosphate synthase [Mycobacteriales bacterium]|jgi:thiamine-phosphate pyrophosphorylase|nr:thiamine phosphate synthase [Mycobacteriales bacterium]
MTKNLDLGLYLVTDTGMCGERGVVDTVRAAVDGGVTVVQLRDHGATAHRLYEMTRELLDALHGTGVPLIVNDRIDVALAAGAAGVHLGQGDLPVEQARRLAGPEFLIGRSTNRIDQIQAVNALPAGTVDYIGIGPVFFTQTKPHAASPVGAAGVAERVPISRVPAVAIGGIGRENAAEVRATGVGGVAVVSAICAADDPRAAAAALR